MLYLNSCRCGGMVDAVDSKSTPSNRVLVRVQSSANRSYSKKTSLLKKNFLHCLAKKEETDANT